MYRAADNVPLSVAFCAVPSRSICGERPHVRHEAGHVVGVRGVRQPVAARQSLRHGARTAEAQHREPEPEGNRHEVVLLPRRPPRVHNEDVGRRDERHGGLRRGVADDEEVARATRGLAGRPHVRSLGAQQDPVRPGPPPAQRPAEQVRPLRSGRGADLQEHHGLRGDPVVRAHPRAGLPQGPAGHAAQQPPPQPDGGEDCPRGEGHVLRGRRAAGRGLAVVAVEGHGLRRGKGGGLQKGAQRTGGRLVHPPNGPIPRHVPGPDPSEDARAHSAEQREVRAAQRGPVRAGVKDPHAGRRGVPSGGWGVHGEGHGGPDGGKHLHDLEHPEQGPRALPLKRQSISGRDQQHIVCVPLHAPRHGGRRAV